MTNLWCNHALFPGRWQPGNGFNRVLPHEFNNITDLWSQISTITSSASIRKLGILVHGEEGVLKTGSDGVNLVTPDRINHDAQLRSMLTNIGSHLRPDATVSFYSCSAGASTQGDELLKTLSSIWPGRTIVGAISKGYLFGTMTAGDIKDTLLTVINQLRHTDTFYVPGQSTERGRNSFLLPFSRLPKFLSVEATVKKAVNGNIIDNASGLTAFRQFELSYPAETRSIILQHPAQMISNVRCYPGDQNRVISPTERNLGFCPPGNRSQYSIARSDSQFYSNVMINIDHPPEYGSELLRTGRELFQNY